MFSALIKFKPHLRQKLAKRAAFIKFNPANLYLTNKSPFFTSL
ncbi:hypothetical protein CSUNSWCD_1252 [Campylobacter showae CSUNSWCD]|uniref:Uncharacterized protein n=1 Tax=Campylobacter showae CSUNSWCD TaxID=1244083 RepID=M5ISM5_9BACT|nr:hypothetical protein CSUNSWCD_1252 [Campylobacter showae CSUNSWCD]